jgi:hypothetical protein
MKKSLTFFAILLFYNSSIAQQLVQNTSQVYLLKDNEELFINKPLKNLLKEIKPEIKTAHVFNDENSSFFGFRFTTLAQQRKNEGAIVDRVTLLKWTPNDAQKFADYIVTHIAVVAESED